MSDMKDDEKEPLVVKPPEIHIHLERVNNVVFGAYGVFKWSCVLLVLIARLIGLAMFTVWASDCFFREFKTTALCRNFVLFPRPQVFESVWLFLCIGTSFFLIFYIRLLPNFPGFLATLNHLIRRKYFYKIVFILLLVCIYDLVVILDKPKTSKTIPYVLFMVEKSLAVALVLFLNFLPSFLNGGWSNSKSTLKFYCYKATLALYAFECYTMAILGSTIAVYKVLTVAQADEDPSIQEIRQNLTDTDTGSARLLRGKNAVHSGDPPDVKAVVDLMLLMANNGLRYYLAEFFLSKFFDQNVDILGGGTKDISESLTRKRDAVTSTAVDSAQESEEASSHVAV